MVPVVRKRLRHAPRLAPIPDLPLLTSSTLRTLAPLKEEAVAEAKQRIDRILSRLDA
jgi:hypothetical protein